jgi:hypothetical protein
MLHPVIVMDGAECHLPVMLVPEDAGREREGRAMATYYAVMMDGETGAEGNYRFEGPADLMKATADEVVALFFDYAQHDVLQNGFDWELNGVMKNRERGVVTAMGSLIPDKEDPPIPFLLMISDRGARTAAN